MRVVMSFAACCAALAACGPGGGGTQAPTAAPAAPAPAMDAAARQAALASLPPPYNTADVENGRKQFGLCRSCHTIAEGGPNMTGPNLHGIFGSRAGARPDYNYSDALKAADFVWTAEQLDRWLAEPKTFLPGNKMTFLGVKDPKNRTDLIAYLKVESGYRP